MRPLQEFVQTEAADGVLLLAAALAALLWANLPNDSYNMVMSADGSTSIAVGTQADK